MFLLESKCILGFVTIAAGWMFRVCTGSINEVSTRGSEIDGVMDSIKNLGHIHLNERRYARSLTNRRKNCNTWAPWVNENHPSPSHKEDKEVIPQKSLDDFCPLGSISKFECKDNLGEPFHENQTSVDGKYIKSCYDIHVGVICTVLDPTLKQCPDMSIRYYCSCNAQPSNLTPSGTSPSTTGSITSKSTTSPILKLVSTLIPGLVGTSSATTASFTTATATTTSAKSLKSSKTESTLIPGLSGVDTRHATDTASVNKLTDGEVNKQTMLQIGGLSIPWWAFVLLISGVFFVTSVCVSVCLYKKATSQIKMNHTSTSVHPMDFV